MVSWPIPSLLCCLIGCQGGDMEKEDNSARHFWSQRGQGQSRERQRRRGTKKWKLEGIRQTGSRQRLQLSRHFFA